MINFNHSICQLEMVNKKIDEHHILKDVTFNLKKGKVTALLGPNGAGKTTTIRVILGLLKPTSGKVSIFGIDAGNNPEQIRGKIGLLPQINSGYKGLTGRQNIDFLIELVGKNKKECAEKIDELLKRLELDEIANKDWAVLSGGEQRALGFIRAILIGDDLLVLDEPTTGLDLARSAIIRKIMQEEIKNGKTILMSSHIITDLEELAEEIIIMRDGKVVHSGTRDEITEHFAKDGSLEDAIVASFLGQLQ